MSDAAEKGERFIVENRSTIPMPDVLEACGRAVRRWRASECPYGDGYALDTIVTYENGVRIWIHEFKNKASIRLLALDCPKEQSKGETT